MPKRVLDLISVFGIKSLLSGAMTNRLLILMLEGTSVDNSTKVVPNDGGNEKEGLKKRFTEL